MELTTVWFIVIAFLWIGYFALEGFDFGVGILLPVLAKDETERRVMINTIGPVWDGNEVWLLVAGGATFAAFPHWYATLFSGFYLPLLLILVALIVRGVAFEYRHKRHDAQWQSRWEPIRPLFSAPSRLCRIRFPNTSSRGYCAALAPKSFNASVMICKHPQAPRSFWRDSFIPTRSRWRVGKVTKRPWKGRLVITPVITTSRSAFRCLRSSASPRAAIRSTTPLTPESRPMSRRYSASR